MVRMSVFDRRTLPTDLWLTGDNFVGKLSATGQPANTTQPFVPPWLEGGIIYVFTCIYKDYAGGEHYNGRLKIRLAVLIQAKVRDHRLRLLARLYAGPVCDDSAAEAACAASVALYK